MNFLDHIFIIKGITENDEGFTAIVETNPDHPVYQAHFPGNPITPGACLIQTACTLLELKLGHQVWLRTIKSVKFLSSIVPAEGKEVKFSFSPLTVAETGSKAQVIISDDHAICAKMSLIFSHEPL